MKRFTEKSLYILTGIIICGSMLISCIRALPAIDEFISENPRFGTRIINTLDQPDWAKGKRQKVATDRGTYVFYLEKDKVVEVWELRFDGSKKLVYKK